MLCLFVSYLFLVSSSRLRGIIGGHQHVVDCWKVLMIIDSVLGQKRTVGKTDLVIREALTERKQNKTPLGRGCGTDSVIFFGTTIQRCPVVCGTGNSITVRTESSSSHKVSAQHMHGITQPRPFLVYMMLLAVL